MKRPLRCLLTWHAWKLAQFDEQAQRVTMLCSACGAQRERLLERPKIGGGDHSGPEFR